MQNRERRDCDERDNQAIEFEVLADDSIENRRGGEFPANG